MYRGLGPTILGYLPTWAIYFAVYDGIKTTFGEAPLGVSSVDHKGTASNRNGRVYPAAQVKGYQPVMREHPWSLHILSAMTAGATSTICTNPLWVIKTRFMVCLCAIIRFPLPPSTRVRSCVLFFLISFCFVRPSQTQPHHEGRYRNTLDAFLTIYRSEGASAFYRGLFPSLFGITHVAVQFPLYEKLKIWARTFYFYIFFAK